MSRRVGAFYLQIICSKLCFVLFLGLCTCATLRAQEPPYFVTYSDVMEEPGNLELSYKGINAAPKNANAFNSATVEFEYGIKAYWTTEVYLSGQSTQNDSTIFTGFRWENRFRPLMRTHFINPVLYAEYEDTNFADRSFLEITGHQSISDLYVPNAQARHGKSDERTGTVGVRLCAGSDPSADAGRRSKGLLVLPGEFHRRAGTVWRAGNDR